MKALVTGASGFIGGNLCRALAQAGHQVTGLVRVTSDLSPFADTQTIKLATGDITDPDGLGDAMHGIEVVFHTAAMVADWGPWPAFRAANVDSVWNVLEAASAAGVRRVVYLSSAGVYGFPGGVDIPEEQPIIRRGDDLYSISKRCGETIAMAFHHDRDVDVTIVRPATVYGPGDHTTSRPLAEALLAGSFAYIDGGRYRLAPVYIDNLVQLLLRAATSEAAAGEAFNVTDDGAVCWREFIGWLAGELDCRPPRWSIPRQLAWPAAVMVECLARVLGKQKSPLINRYRVRAVSNDHHYSCAKAKKLLGYRPEVSTREGIRRTAAWYLSTIGEPRAADKVAA